MQRTNRFYFGIIAFVLLLFHPVIFGFALLDANDDETIQAGVWPGAALQVYSTGAFDFDSFEEQTEELFSLWNNVTTSTFELTYLGGIDENCVDPLDNTDGIIVMVFDDGTVMEEALGGDSSSILGFAYPFTEDGTNGYFFDAIIVLNGDLIDEDTYVSTVLHELGHVFGLDHTANVPSADVSSEYSTMFSYNYSDEQSDLHVDDEASISVLYPEDSFSETWGALTGVIEDEFGVPQFGVAVIAYDYDTGYPITSTLTGFPLYFSSEYSVESLGGYLLPVPADRRILLKAQCGFWGSDAVIDEAGGSGIGSADFGNTEGYLENPLERSGFDLGCPSEYDPNFSSSAGANPITSEANTVKTDINFTVWDEDLDQSARISFLTDCPNSYALTLLVGSSSSDPDKTIALKPNLSEEEMNIYMETELSGDTDDYLPPSSSHKWFLQIERNASVEECNYKTLLNFTIKHDGKIYLPTEIATFPKEISNRATNTYEVDGSSVLDEANPPSNLRSLQFSLPEEISDDGIGGKTSESCETSGGVAAIGGANSTDPDEEIADGCSSCNVGQRPFETPSAGILVLWVGILVYFFMKRTLRRKE
jgi:hypothetical protein